MEKKGYQVSKELKVKNREVTSSKSDNAEDLNDSNVQLNKPEDVGFIDNPKDCYPLK